MSKIEYSIVHMIDDDLQALVCADQPILVSGQPLRVFHESDKSLDQFFDDCTQMDEEVLLPPFRVFMQMISRASNSYLPEHYLPQDNTEGYPAIQGFTMDGAEVVLGISQALGFSVKAVPAMINNCS